MNQDLNNIGDVFRNGFEGYSVEPSKSLWTALKHKLWLQSFVKFSLGSFNVYYAASIAVTTIIGSLAIVSNLDQQEKTETNNIEIDNKQETPEQLNKNENYLPEDYYATPELNERPESQPKNEKTKTKPIVSKETEKTIGIKSKIDLNEIEESENIVVSEKIETRKLTIPDVQNDTEIIENNTEIAKSSTIKSNTVFADNKQLPDFIEQETTVYDTIVFFDTLVFYDTVSVRLPSEKIKTSAKITFDLFGGANITSFNYQHDIQEFQDTLNNYTSASSGYQAGMRVNLHINKFEFSTGISYQQIEEDFSYNRQIQQNNPIEYWDYYEIEPIHTIDTTDWVFVFDPLDSSYVSAPIINETYISQYDSNLNVIPVYTTNIENYNNLNKYSYLNIPLSMGYKFYDRDNVSLSAKIGGNMGIFINAKGKGISLLDRKSVIQIDKDELPFMKTNFSWMLGLAVNYRFNEKLSVMIEPWYRGSLNSIFDSNHPVTLKTNPIGLNIGLRFHL